MKIILPMAGTGDRFVRAGYLDPKPLIDVGVGQLPEKKKKIIRYILDMFDTENDDITFICNHTHLQTTDMEAVLKSYAPKSKIIGIPNHKQGPAFTVLNAQILDSMDPEEEVIVSYCDNPYLWDYDDFKRYVRDTNSDGCILSHSGFHPHRLSPTFMAHIKERDLVVEAVKEKEPYTDNPIQEQASTGTYYFKKVAYVKKYFQEQIDKQIHHKGEFYITLTYNLMIADGLKVTCYPTKHAMVFGTPEEVQNFEAWQTILQGIQVKNEDDLIKCYRYWKEYNEVKK